MRILFLGPASSPVYEFLLAHNRSSTVQDDLAQSDTPPPVADINRADPPFIVSHGCRYLVSEYLLGAVNHWAINLHIGYLPWNRGADPNLWSFLDHTPKGVTLHWMTGALDAGPIIAQTLVPMHPGDTLKTSYDRLQATAVQLFRDVWYGYTGPNFPSVPQAVGGSFHWKSDRRKVEHLLTKGWDTPIESLHSAGHEGVY